MLPAPSNQVGSFRKLDIFDQTYRLVSTDGTESGYTEHTVIETDAWAKSPTVRNNWRVLKGRPWRDPSSYSRKVIKYRWIRGSHSRPFPSNPTGQTEYFDGVFSGPNPADFNPHWMAKEIGVQDTDAYRQAITECLLKLNDSKAKVGQYLAESRQSANMIADAGTDLLTLLLKVKRGDLKGLPLNYGVLSRKARDYYLQWQFGWKPLCMDIYGLYDNLINRLPIQPFLSASRTVKTPYNYSLPYGGHDCKVNIKHTDTCKLWASLSEQTLATAQSYDVINPLSLTWELVPYSFVVDWFAPIGNTLASLTATAGLDFIGGYSGQVREGTNIIECLAGHVEQEFFFYTRAAHSDFPQVGYYGKQNPLNLDKATKLLGLLSQLY